MTTAGMSASERVQLRNDGSSTEQRVWQVYNSLQKLLKIDRYQYYWLWRTACVCNRLNLNNCVLNESCKDADKYYLKHLEPKTLAFLEAHGITKQGILTKETQDIIISAYYGSSDPKIVDIQHPVPGFVETYVPFASSLRSIFHVLTY